MMPVTVVRSHRASQSVSPITVIHSMFFNENILGQKVYTRWYRKCIFGGGWQHTWECMGDFGWYKAFGSSGWTAAGGFGEFCLDEREQLRIIVVRKPQKSNGLEHEWSRRDCWCQMSQFIEIAKCVTAYLLGTTSEITAVPLVIFTFSHFWILFIKPIAMSCNNLLQNVN